MLQKATVSDSEFSQRQPAVLFHVALSGPASEGLG